MSSKANAWRRAAARDGNISLRPAEGRAQKARYLRSRQGARVHLPAKDGCVFVISDQHYFPGMEPSNAHKAAIALAHELHPWAIVNNGDTIDGASISRWPVASYEALGEQPTVAEEIREAFTRLGEFEDFLGSFVDYLVWNLGNHDARFETRLADKAPEFVGTAGFTLKEHFPTWIPAWGTWISPNGKPGEEPLVIIKHRFKGGQYAAATSTLWAGVSTVTGHDHQLYVKPVSDYRGLRWGIDAGTLADPYSPHFKDYTEDNPQNWQSGFVILHFRDGKFTGPELVHSMPNGDVLFRGDILEV